MRPAGYRLGILIILATVAAAGVLAFGFARDPSGPPRAAQDLGDAAFELGRFALTERSGRTITEADLADRVWIAAFVFTRCPSSCPKISAVMKSLEPKLAGTGIQLVSLTVDPEHDTPQILAKYASSLGASRDRWWFLTGPPERMHELLLDRFKVPATRVDPAELAAAGGPERLEEIRHSSKLALVGPGNRVMGYFDSEDPKALALIQARARKLDRPWLAALPSVNAGLNASSGVLLLLGWLSILSRRARLHIVCMVAALATSAVFLTCYLVYHAQVGSIPFQGLGLARRVYLTILGSHTVLAVVIVPLIVAAVLAAVRRRFATHVKITRVTLPIWLYVSVTGVVVYWMLYHLDQTPLSG